jgi:hypothetical protein
MPPFDHGNRGGLEQRRGEVYEALAQIVEPVMADAAQDEEKSAEEVERESEKLSPSPPPGSARTAVDR